MEEAPPNRAQLNFSKLRAVVVPTIENDDQGVRKPSKTLSQLKRSLSRSNDMLRHKVSKVSKVSIAKSEQTNGIKIAQHQDVISHFRLRRISLSHRHDIAIKGKYTEGPKMLIMPTNHLYRLWQLVTMALVFYQTFALPFYLAFPSTESGGTTNFVIDMLFVVDLLLNFNLAVPDPQLPDSYITKRKMITIMYLKGWFFIDLLACIPFDNIAIAIQDGDADNLQAFGLLKGLRLPRLLRLVRLLRVLRMLRISPELKRWLQYSRHANLLRLLRLIVMFLAVTHFMACVWQGAVVGEEWLTSHVFQSSTQHRYLMAFYTSLLLIMGENVEPLSDTEILFSSICLLLGAVVMAIVFGNVAVLIANFTANSSAHQKKMEQLYETMRRLQLPSELQTRIHQYYMEMWERHGTLNGKTGDLVNELSSNLASEVMLYMRMEMITSVPFFRKCSPEVVHEIVMKLRLEVYMPDDYVLVAGEIGNDMYFVQSGKCNVTIDLPNAHDARGKKIETVVKTLDSGDYFGEIALLMNCKRTANVQAATFVELCLLSREVFDEVANRYTDDREVMEKIIREKYSSPNNNNSATKAAVKQLDFVPEENNHEEKVSFNQERIITLLESLAAQLESSKKDSISQSHKSVDSSSSVNSLSSSHSRNTNTLVRRVSHNLTSMQLKRRASLDARTMVLPTNDESCISECSSRSSTPKDRHAAASEDSTGSLVRRVLQRGRSLDPKALKKLGVIPAAADNDD